MQVLRIILTIIFAIDCIALTTVVLMRKGDYHYGGVVLCSGPCIKYYLLRMIWSKKETLLYIRKSAFFSRFL